MLDCGLSKRGLPRGREVLRPREEGGGGGALLGTRRCCCGCCCCCCCSSGCGLERSIFSGVGSCGGVVSFLYALRGVATGGRVLLLAAAILCGCGLTGFGREIGGAEGIG